MNLARQSGIALVQVLLISALLLLLVVQLSLTAKTSVNLAIQLKEKSQASIKAQDQFANAQYALLTQEKSYSLVWNNGVVTGFSGSEFAVESGVTVRLQDLSGYLSTSFFGLEWINYVNGDNQKLNILKDWQGLTEDRRYSRGKRNARIPYTEEVTLLQGWENQNLDYITRLPTGFFNIAMTPEPLLREIYPEDTVTRVLELRNSGEIVRSKFTIIDGLENSTPFPRSNFIEVSVEAQSSDNIKYIRNRIYDVQTQKSVPIVEIGIGTP